MIEQAQTKKKSTRRGKPIGLKYRAQITIHINDDDRNVSRLWEIVKRYHSGQKQTAAETARRCFLRGLAAELEDITLQNNKIAKEEFDRQQGRLFEC